MSINYIVAFYIGPGRTYNNFNTKLSQDPLLFVKQHIEFLNQYKGDNITQATFVFNDDINSELKTQIDSLIFSCGIPIQILLRKNGGFSYGSWNDAILLNKTFDYYFLLEDDYIPAVHQFYQPFIEKMVDNVCYVCCYVEQATSAKYRVVPPGLEFNFPSISNGLISGNYCREIYKKYNSLFYLKKTNDYVSAWDNQIMYLYNFIKEGLVVTDLISEYSFPFIDIRPHGFYERKIFGTETNPILIKPIEII